MSDWWKEWHEIKPQQKDRAIVFFGRSEDWIPKALNKIAPICIVDNNLKYDGTHYRNVEVCLPRSGLYRRRSQTFCSNYCWYSMRDYI